MRSIRLYLAGIFLWAGAACFAQQKTTGVLLLAHGGSEGWNQEVTKIAGQVDKAMPTEVAFGMATKRTMQDAIGRLVQRGVGRIVAVPLFVSSHSSVITSTQYLLGARKEAPKELAIYAKMNHGSHGSHESHGAADASFDPMTPVSSPVPIRVTPALDRHRLVGEILLSRAEAISRTPASEVVILVAHGPVLERENNEWLEDMGALAGIIRATGKFAGVGYLTVRDDAPEPIRSEATKELRTAVEHVAAQDRKALIVPLLISFGGIEGGIRKRLEGLSYTMATQGLLPDDRLAGWVLSSARTALEKK